MRINYPAVLVAAIAYWLLGGLWYGVLFNKPWAAPPNRWARILRFPSSYRFCWRS